MLAAAGEAPATTVVVGPILLKGLGGVVEVRLEAAILYQRRRQPIEVEGAVGVPAQMVVREVLEP